MCLLFFQKGKQKISEAEFNKSWSSNPDGFGISVRCPNGDMYTKKFMALNEAKEFYFGLKDEDYNDLVGHFRLGTSGLTNIDMVHPFKLNHKGDAVLFHNGVLSGVPFHEGKSDTASLAHWISNLGLPDKCLFYNAVTILFEGLVENYNKFIVLSKDNIKIIGENLGHWDKERDIWFSNQGYKVYQAYTGYGNIYINPTKKIEDEDESWFDWRKYY